MKYRAQIIFIFTLLGVSSLKGVVVLASDLDTNQSVNSNQCVSYLAQSFSLKVVTGREEIRSDSPGFFMYKDYDYKFNFEASLTKGQLSIETELIFPRKGIRSRWSGKELYALMMEAFGPENIKTINGVWASGTNYDEYTQNLESMTPEVAALNTWSGRMAQSYGFNNVRIMKASDPDAFGLLEEGESAVLVIFTR